jgi:hypothetical protein
MIAILGSTETLEVLKALGSIDGANASVQETIAACVEEVEIFKARQRLYVRAEKQESAGVGSYLGGPMPKEFWRKSRTRGGVR